MTAAAELPVPLPAGEVPLLPANEVEAEVPVERDWVIAGAGMIGWRGAKSGEETLWLMVLG